MLLVNVTWICKERSVTDEAVNTKVLDDDVLDNGVDVDGLLGVFERDGVGDGADHRRLYDAELASLGDAD